ncbi:DUF3810 domain-containing protein [Neotamlana laminarinivorans]|uniref:DUF3810 domain-containing protein n=1 Tax=Neotamlana laminarinivorans TaxID=2883124 RepID=A0A9X1HZS0_9FLAO|nr:DUF3810 domain-containing protein [Tamlana laminarinivorans]MCB4798790.1 DUF3810 domain-containing protein [Tamlana laminarinivorans]
MPKNKKLVLAFAIVPQFLFVKLLANFPEFIETYYSNGLYIYISKALRFTLGWLPFSFGDLVYSLAVVYIIRWIFINGKRILSDTKHWLIDVFAAVSVIYFAFHMFWGLNYYRLPLHENLNLEADYTTEQLVLITEKLISKSNEAHFNITKNDTLIVNLPYTKNEILKLAPDGYKALKQTFPDLEYYPESAKKSLFSFPLTYMGFSGYLNPLTNEAQVNSLIPSYKFPTTTTHEMAHQLGYAAENEANFIGCLAAINHKDAYFKYTGYSFALHFCLNEIYRRDVCLFEDLIADVNLGVLKNYEETRLFWEAHQNPAEPYFKQFYSGFLKANKQSKGMESYSYVVALLTNYFNEKSL